MPLQEIQDISGKDMLQLTQSTLMKLLTALNDCTEWGQVFILDALAGFETKDPRDAEKIVERVIPRMQHVNSAVVMSAVKVIMGVIVRMKETWKSPPVVSKRLSLP